MRQIEEVFKHRDVTIWTVWNDLGKTVDVSIRNGDICEIVPTSDPRARDAFIALHNSKINELFPIFPLD
jgi:hypothetical protein